MLCRPPKLDENGKPKSKIGPRSWVYYFPVEGQPNKRASKGFGGYPSTPTTVAVAKAREWKSKLEQGIDPREEEQELKNQIKRNLKLRKTFSEAAQDWHDFQIARPNRSSQDYKKKFKELKSLKMFYYSRKHLI